MVKRTEIKKLLSSRSDRVKAVDFHPVEPWILCALYNGKVYIYNYETQLLLRTFDITEVPVRACRFIARKNWIVTGSDDFQLRVFNYNTQERVISFEAHPDYIRCITVHPTQSFVLTGSDDMTIKLWNWDQDWKCVRVFEGHSHYVMSLAINPKDTNTFASSCLDRTVKVWNFASSTANYTLDAHDKGVNHVDYYHASDKPYLITTGDDKLVKIWDYQTKACVQTLEGHTSNVSFACFHPTQPIIVSGSEDGTVKVWHANTYRLEQTLNYGLERAWCCAYLRGKQEIGMGFDEGVVVIRLGKEEPAVSMDSTGKIIWAKFSEIETAMLKPADADVQDGAKLLLSVKEMGSSEIYPQTLAHSPNGRFVAALGDGEYIIYTALRLNNKAFGPALDFVWASNSNEYAIRESTTSIRLYKNFKERTGVLNVPFAMEGLFGGHLVGVRGSSWICFYDWDTGSLVRRINEAPRNVYWSDSGELLAIATEESFYVLRFNRAAYGEALASGTTDPNEGVEDAFDVVVDISESVRTAKWVGDVCIYTTLNRLQYLVGEQAYTITHIDPGLYLLGYIARDGRVYLSDKDVNIISYALSLSVVEYQTVILRGDMDTAETLLSQIPADQMPKIARFLEGQGYKEKALEVSTDPEQRFELALQLHKLDVACQLARQSNLESKWKQVGDAALAAWDLDLAEECFKSAKDLGSLLLLYTATGSRQGLQDLSSLAQQAFQNNIAFTCELALGNISACVDLLVSTGRTPEAVLFSRTYKPSLTAGLVEKWKGDLNKNGKEKLAKSIASPDGNLELFPEWPDYLEKERGSESNGVEEAQKKLEGISLDNTNGETKEITDITAESTEIIGDGDSKAD